MKYKLKTYSKKLLADTLTPVNIYLKLRDVYAGSILAGKLRLSWS